MEKLSDLAMLCEYDEENLKEDIDMVIKMAQILSEIDESEAVFSESMTLREDEACEEFDREEMLCNAPCTSDGFIIVPGGLV